jgi:hypothetical protein
MAISSEESGRPSGLPALPQSALGWSYWWLPWYLLFGCTAALNAGSSGSLFCAAGIVRRGKSSAHSASLLPLQGHRDAAHNAGDRAVVK